MISEEFPQRLDLLLDGERLPREERCGKGAANLSFQLTALLQEVEVERLVPCLGDRLARPYTSA